MTPSFWKYVWSTLCALALLAVVLHSPSVSAREDAVLDLQLLLNQTALNTRSATDRRISQCRQAAVYIVWGAGTSAGAVQVESAHLDTFAGTWAPIGTAVAWSAANKEDIVQLSGIHGALATRISTAIVGGSVSTWVVCN